MQCVVARQSRSSTVDACVARTEEEQIEAERVEHESAEGLNDAPTEEAAGVGHAAWRHVGGQARKAEAGDSVTLGADLIGPRDQPV